MSDETITHPLLKPPPFVVEEHKTMFMRVAGKGDTVLTLERNIYSWNIYEYSDPLFRRRAWWYPEHEFGVAVSALLDYMEVEVAPEPQGWLRADDIDEQGRSRTRRAHIEAGERVITVDGPEEV
jgi:hypothetical protein